MAAKKGMKWQDIRRLGDLHHRLGVALDDMTQLVDAMLHAEPYSKKEVCDILNIASDELDDTSLNQQTKQGEFVAYRHVAVIMVLETHSKIVRI